jgi:hypothetical protein
LEWRKERIATVFGDETGGPVGSIEEDMESSISWCASAKKTFSVGRV